MTDAPTIRTPAWAGNLRLLGFCLGVASIVATVIDIMEGGHALAATVRNVAAPICAVLFVIVAGHWWMTMRSYRRAVAALGAATPTAQVARQQTRFIEEMTRDAAEAHLGGWPFAGADVLNLLARHDLITQAGTDAALEAARVRLGEQYEVDLETAGHSLPVRAAGFDKALDDEIPF
jgi:hypothetical protein